MKKKWDFKNLEVIMTPVSIEEYNQRLDEAAELLYRYFCQLCENQALAPVTNTVRQTYEKRTGTDG